VCANFPEDESSSQAGVTSRTVSKLQGGLEWSMH